MHWNKDLLLVITQNTLRIRGQLVYKEYKESLFEYYDI